MKKLLRALITGASGFVGWYLAGHLASQGYEVFGCSLIEPERHDPNCQHLYVDLLDAPALQKIFRTVQPSEVYHLAAISSVAESWKNPVRTYEINVLGTANMLEAAGCLATPPRVLNVSTSQVYDKSLGEAIAEDSPVRPCNPYAASKAMAELLMWQYIRRYEMFIVTARSFNHSGPGQSPSFVLPSFAKQVADIQLGLQEPELRVGDIDVERDFLHVKDVVRAYRLLLARGRRGEVYNVCSGNPYRLRTALEYLLRAARVEVRIEVDPEKRRTDQAPRICGDCAKLKSETGWKQEISFQDLLAELLEYWSSQVGFQTARSI